MPNIASTCQSRSHWLSLATWEDREVVVKRLLDKNADVESKDNRYGRTPHSWTTEHSYEAVVKLPFDKNADVESKDESGRTWPLWTALQTAGDGCEAVAKLLLDKNADVESG
jgi:ankyrin repeat protein